MRLKKTQLACVIASVFPCLAFGAPITVTPDTPNVTPPSDETVDSILFDTNNQDFEASLGKDQTIEKLIVTDGLVFDDYSGGGKLTFNLSANSLELGGKGIEFGSAVTVVGQPPQSGSLLNIDANNLVVKGESSAVRVGGHSTIALGNQDQRITSVELSAGDSSAIYASDDSTVKIFAKDFVATSNSDNSYASALYATDGSLIAIDAGNDLSITNTNERGTAIAIKQSGEINLTAGNDLTIIANEQKEAISLQQSDGNKGSVSLKGNTVTLVGQVIANNSNLNEQNSINLLGTEFVSITANTVGGTYKRGGAIEGQNNAYFNLEAGGFSITNKSNEAATAGIYLGSDGSSPAHFNGTFSGSGTITAETGIIVHSSASTFSLTGDQQQNSVLTINGKLAGLHSQANAGTTTIRDTSIVVTLDKDTSIPDSDKWDIPTRTEGVVGISSFVGAVVELGNTNSLDKTLQITVDADVDSYNASAVSASMGGAVKIDHFDSIVMNVTNEGRGSQKYGLRANSGQIEMKEGVGNVSITANNGTALYSSSASGYTTGLIDISAKEVSLFGTGSSGKGIESNSGASVQLAVEDKLTVSAKDAIKVSNKESSIAIKAETSSESSIIGDWSVAQGKVDASLGNGATIEGDLTSSQSGELNLSLGNQGLFKGKTSTGILLKGSVNMTLGEGSQWQVTDDSTATSLNLTGTSIDFSSWEPEVQIAKANDVYRTVTTQTLSGDNNTLRMKINLGEESVNQVLTDQLTVKGKAQGSQIADITINGRELVPEKYHSENWLVSQGADSNMTILNKEGTNEFSGNGMVTTWALSFVADGEEGKLDSAEGLKDLADNTTGTGSGKWYLVRTDEEKVDPKPDPDPDPEEKPDPKPDDPSEMQQLTNLGISATQAMSFTTELDDLRTRLGEVRYGAQDGAWVKAGYAKERADGYNGRGFEQKTQDLHIGVDRLVVQSEDGAWLVGGVLRYAKTDQEGFAAAGGGDGELEQYSAKLYATYMHAQGSYADFVLQAGRYSQDITGLANDKSSAFSADYDTYGYGASVEVGHMFSFNEKINDRQWYNHTFVEPQLHLSYFKAHGKDYTTSTGMAVSQSDADFLTTRAGLVLGQKFNYGTVDDLDKRYFQIGLKGGVKYEFMGDQDIRFTGVEGVTKTREADDVDGARYYYGVTADWQLSDDFRAYASLEREEGDDYTKEFDVSVGVKYQF